MPSRFRYTVFVSSASERRTDPRYGAHFDVRFSRASDAAKAFKAFSVNFSSGGLCLRSKTPHAIGETLSMSLSVEGEVFDLEGVVAWVRGEAVGVRFVNILPAVRSRLEAVSQQLAIKST